MLLEIELGDIGEEVADHRVGQRAGVERPDEPLDILAGLQIGGGSGHATHDGGRSGAAGGEEPQIVPAVPLDAREPRSTVCAWCRRCCLP